MSPKRIQRQRTKGWRTPLCSCGCGRPAIYVGRPTIWGNRYSIYPCVDKWRGWRVVSEYRGDAVGPIFPTRLDATRDAVRRFRRWLSTRSPSLWRPLRGHDLMCWCPLEDSEGHRAPCHADVLLELANQAEVPDGELLTIATPSCMSLPKTQTAVLDGIAWPEGIES